MAETPRQYIDGMDDRFPSLTGKERQVEILGEALDSGTFTPHPLQYNDIDDAFKKWVENDLEIISPDGNKFPTMSMYSNQRFSEYSQTWKYTDSNKNLLLNFKSIQRENNPQYGKIQDGLWNIPGQRMYTIRKTRVLDDNGNESLLTVRMRQPVSVDLMYTVSIFATNYKSINEFNEKMNVLFSARQVYIQPNGHYIPMVLDNIQDESQYNIDDRQFYSQSYVIKVMAYILRPEDFDIVQKPLKFGFKDIGGNCLRAASKRVKSAADVELEECEEPEYNPYYYKPISITITFPKCVYVAKFIIDTRFVMESITTENIRPNYSIYRNNEKIEGLTTFNEGDTIKVSIDHQRLDKKSVMVITGYDDHTVYDEDKLSEIDMDEDRYWDDYLVDMPCVECDGKD